MSSRRDDRFDDAAERRRGRDVDRDDRAAVVGDEAYEERGGAGARGVDVRDERISVERVDRDVGVREARRGFGGLDLPATLVGMLTALALLLLLAGLVGAAIGAVGYQMGVEGREEELSIAGLIGGLIVLFVSFFVGGWAAGRIARYDGVLNGLMTGVWAIVLAVILSALAAWLGSEYDVLRNVELPQFFSRDALTVGGIVSGLVAIAAMLGGGALGGRTGERYHRRVDATIADTRPGGIAP